MSVKQQQKQQQQQDKDSSSYHHQPVISNLWTRESLQSLGTFWIVSLALVAYVFLFVKKAPKEKKA
jgi:hypothetical protein